MLIYFITDLLFQDESGKSKLYSHHQYWKHNIGTAAACNLLSSELKIGDKYKLFSYGLCHDIGFAVLGACLPEAVEKVYQTMEKGVHQVVAERIALGGLTHPINARIMLDLGVSTELVQEIGESLPAEVEKIGKLFAIK